MPKTKVTVTLDASLVERVDELVARRRFRNRSQAIEDALVERLERLARTRLARESAKLNPKEEKALAEEGFARDMESWPDSRRRQGRRGALQPPNRKSQAMPWSLSPCRDASP